jgi:hypothetical protein
MLRPSQSLPAKPFCYARTRNIERAREDAREGKSPSTRRANLCGKRWSIFARGNMARVPLSKLSPLVVQARRAGVKLPPPKRGSARTKKQAARDSRKAGSRRKPSRTRSRAVRKALKREPRRAASHVALSRQARSAARRRPKASRSSAARKSCAHAQAKPLNRLLTSH